MGARALKPIRIAGLVLVALLLFGLTDAGSGSASPAAPASHNCTTSPNGWTCTLTVTAHEGGTITSSDGGIKCGSDCSQAYPLGPNNPTVSVTLTATAASGWRFGTWTGCDAVQGNVCTVRLEHSRTVTATFARASYRLTVSVAGTGSGTVTGQGISCPGDCVEDVAPGSSVALTATAASGSVWAGWGGDCSGAATACSVAMSADRTVTATFQAAGVAPAMHGLTVTVSGGSGKVTGAGIDCPGTCAASYAAGADVTLTATPGAGATVLWGGDCASAGSAATCTVAMTATRSVTAAFLHVDVEPQSVPDIGEGKADPLPARLPPAVEQVIVRIDGTGKVTSSAGARVVAGTAATKPINCGTSGSGPPRFDCYGEYSPDQTLTLSAKPAPGYVFKGWTGACAGNGPTCRVTTRDSRTTTAIFEQGGAGAAVSALLRPPGLRVRWQSSVGVGNLVLRGSTSMPANARVDVRRPGGGPLATVKLKLGGGSFRQSLALRQGSFRGGARLFPGGFTVALTGRAGRLKLPLQMQTISIPAPAEGVVRRAFRSRTQNGKAVSRFAAGTTRVWANFRFETQPRLGQKLSVRWYFPGGKPLGEVQKSNRPVISSYLALDQPQGLQSGLWTAELRTGQRVIQRLSIRVG